MPTLLYDGDCGFCRKWVDRWRESTAGAVEYAPFQQAAARFPALEAEALKRSVHLVEEGRVTRAAEAVFRTLSYAPGGGRLLELYLTLPGFRPISEAIYAFVSKHRPIAARLSPIFLRPRHGAVLARWVYLRLLGLSALVAVAALWHQLDGLVGPDGIWPAATTLAYYREQLGGEAFWRLPSLAWLAPQSFTLLHALCALGVVLATLITVGIAPRWALLGFWAVYLSLVSVGGPFLSFQWDVLLVEACLASAFYAPNGSFPKPATERPPSWVGLFLVRWLCFRLMFLSGAVKLLSGDVAWRDFTAFDYHYWTQPLPSWTSWYVDQLPQSLDKLTVALTFAVELVLPFFCFGPRPLRLVAFFGLGGLQLVLMATGNYSFFNLLAFALCIPLLDDGALRALVRRPLPATALRIVPQPPVGWTATVACYALPIALLGLISFKERIAGRGDYPAPIAWLVESADPFNSANGYGAFAVMTKTRPEIEVEGSADGVTWKSYLFPWKPGPLDRRPTFIAPYQPRLDWQMWFAALGACEQNQWFVLFQRRLLEGAAPVSALLEEDPFAGRPPPKFVRSTVWQYRFATPEERERSLWWRRTHQGPYCPTLTLVGGQLQAVQAR